MECDVFFSICQTDVDGVIPDERTMFEHFFEQVRLADDLGYGTAWVAESHLSTEVQKSNPGAVIPHFKGEIGLFEGAEGGITVFAVFRTMSFVVA